MLFYSHTVPKVDILSKNHLDEKVTFLRHKKTPKKTLFRVTDVYILSVQKLIKNAKKVHFGEFLKT